MNAVQSNPMFYSSLLGLSLLFTQVRLAAYENVCLCQNADAFTTTADIEIARKHIFLRPCINLMHSLANVCSSCPVTVQICNFGHFLSYLGKPWNVQISASLMTMNYLSLQRVKQTNNKTKKKNHKKRKKRKRQVLHVRLRVLESTNQLEENNKHALISLPSFFVVNL